MPIRKIPVTGIKQFLADRNAALASLDEDKIVGFFDSWGVDLPVEWGEFWHCIHLSITKIKELPDETREKSKQWLLDNGYPAPPELGWLVIKH